MSRPEETTTQEESGTSTLASGPAGTHFEAQVGASYLLAMLSGAPARGLPGTTIDKIALQQANAGRPLDDVVVHAHDNVTGEAAVLEIQVKRSVTFAPADPIFRKVVGQIFKASQRPDFLTQRYELAIATTKGSRRIDGACQDVLTLARNVGDADTFATLMDLSGAANGDMRDFVNTFRSHLRGDWATDDNEIVWLLLRRLQILTFDFTAPGSASHDLAIERTVRVLHPEDASLAGALWISLVEMVIDIAKNGGDRNSETTVQALNLQGYRFVGRRQHIAARAALAEASRLALSDIRNRVGRVVLTRQERVAAVRESFAYARYVEIRGNAGVGKSGVLRQIAEATQAEGQVIVLSPGRCVPRGWLAMRSQLGFDGTLRELLVDLANGGGATIFVDNLDFFNTEERATVVDVVSEASLIHGVTIVVTARPEFGSDEPNWLPSDALERLGQTAPIIIGELSKAEIEQLTTTDPSLAGLLKDGHPAHQVARNLFRLSRLASQTSSEPVPRTEVEMAEQWWASADGVRDAGWRDRSRLLQDCATQVLSGSDFLDVMSQSAGPIDALVTSGTLRNLNIDRVAFRHDVLREWAIANFVHADPNRLDRLQLSRPATAMLARGVELAARMSIENANDAESWHLFIERLSQADVHRSWRRAALLALVRSEAAEAIVKRAAPQLLATGAALLRELLRTVIAVEVSPASKVFAAAGIDLDFIPVSMNVPRGQAWATLIIWLLSVGDNVPNEAIPEIVQLYTAFSIGTLGLTDITPFTTRRIYSWLRLMEPSNVMPTSSREAVFWAHLDRDAVQSLKSDLREGFFLFARTTPVLAAEYLKAVAETEHSENIVRSILKMRGTLAQAAPAELADLVGEALIAKPRRRERHLSRMREEPFTYLDHGFLPPSPAQGPFFELLESSPKDGLALVRRLVTHAVADGIRSVNDPEASCLILALPEGARTFPWRQTYLWARNSNYYAVTSALMALEAWAHRRIDAGESVETVLADVLGLPGSCAAYVLVAVDLVISHWPASLGVATAFLSCPELLCLDHARKVHDQVGMPDFFGLGALRGEPRGVVTSADLKLRKSRQITLDELLGNFLFLAPSQMLTTLTTLMKDAAARLGKPAADANLSDPEFMVQHALNLLDVTNWQDIKVSLKDGSTATARSYVSPAAEQDHMHALRDAAKDTSLDFAFQSALSLAIDDPSRLQSEELLASVAWARRCANNTAEVDPDEGRMRAEAVLIAAMIVMRDGNDALRSDHADWARSQLGNALEAVDKDPSLQFRGGLRFNPTAIAFAGISHTLRYPHTPEDVRALLIAAAAGNHAAAHGFGAAVVELDAVDSRLPRSILRCAFSASVFEDRVWDAKQHHIAERIARSRTQAIEAVRAEMEWLYGVGPEPDWPRFPGKAARPRTRLKLPSSSAIPPEQTAMSMVSQTHYLSHQAAALWLRQLGRLSDNNVLPWLNDIVSNYMPWTIFANGRELDKGEETDHAPSEWNDTFFSAVARCVIGRTTDEVIDFAVRHIAELPDRHFYDVLVSFLRNLDMIFFGSEKIPTQVLLDIREEFASRMLTTRGWARLARSKDLSIEMHIAPAIAVMFFNDYYFGQGSKCYLFESGAERVISFAPLLSKLLQAGPSPFVAIVFLNLLEVAPRDEHLEVLVLAGSSWVEAYPDFRQLWIDHGVGRRWCLLIDAIRLRNPTSLSHNVPLRKTIDTLVAAMIALGVPEASRLEEELGKL